MLNCMNLRSVMKSHTEEATQATKSSYVQNAHLSPSLSGYQLKWHRIAVFKHSLF